MAVERAPAVRKRRHATSDRSTEFSLRSLAVTVFFGAILFLVGLRVLVFSALPTGFGHDASPEVLSRLVTHYWWAASFIASLIALVVVAVDRRWRVFPSVFALPTTLLLSVPVTTVLHATSSAIFFSDRYTDQQRLDAVETIISYSLIISAIVFLVLAYFQTPRVQKGRL